MRGGQGRVGRGGEHPDAVVAKPPGRVRQQHHARQVAPTGDHAGHQAGRCLLPCWEVAWPRVRGGVDANVGAEHDHDACRGQAEVVDDRRGRWMAGQQRAGRARRQEAGAGAGRLHQHRRCDRVVEQALAVHHQGLRFAVLVGGDKQRVPEVTAHGGRADGGDVTGNKPRRVELPGNPSAAGGAEALVAQELVDHAPDRLLVDAGDAVGPDQLRRGGRGLVGVQRDAERGRLVELHHHWAPGSSRLSEPGRCGRRRRARSSAERLPAR